MLEDIKLNYKEYDEIKILRCYKDFDQSANFFRTSKHRR